MLLAVTLGQLPRCFKPPQPHKQRGNTEDKNDGTMAHLTSFKTAEHDEYQSLSGYFFWSCVSLGFIGFIEELSIASRKLSSGRTENAK